MRQAIIILAYLVWLSWPFSAQAGLAERLSGLILLNVESHGEAWYVYPEDYRRYYLGRPADAFGLMRQLGLGIKEADFQRLAQAGMPVAGDLELASRLAGRIILQVERNGEAWYIYPKDLKKYYLGRPADAFNIMRQLGLGVSQENLALIHKPGLEESINGYSSYQHTSIITAAGSFSVDLVKINLTNPSLEIISQAAEPFPDDELAQSQSYGAQNLASFVLDNDGFAAINGTYFCSDQACGKLNYYFYPLYNSRTGQLINQNKLKYWTTGPIMAFDSGNKFYYFKDSREFPAPEQFSSSYGFKLQAAIGNKPRLIENGMNLLIDWEIDDRQSRIKSLRNAIGYKENVIYLLVVHNATVPDLALVTQALGLDYALNLDGGYSSALFYNDEYMVGPGRQVPNAIIFREK